jgi:ATP-dependent Lon protease
MKQMKGQNPSFSFIILDGNVSHISGIEEDCSSFKVEQMKNNILLPSERGSEWEELEEYVSQNQRVGQLWAIASLVREESIETCCNHGNIHHRRL